MPPSHKVQVVVITRRPDTQILMLRRSPKRQSVWQPVTGKVDPEDSDGLATARRELFEETGIRALRNLTDIDCEFRFVKAGSEIAERVFLAELETTQPIVLSNEHVEYAWMAPAEALRCLSWDIHRQGVEHALDAIRKRDPGEPDEQPKP